MGTDRSLPPRVSAVQLRIFRINRWKCLLSVSVLSHYRANETSKPTSKTTPTTIRALPVRGEL